MTVLINTRNRSTPRSSNRPPRPGLIFHKRTVSMSHRLRKVLLAPQLACNCQLEVPGLFGDCELLWLTTVGDCMYVAGSSQLYTVCQWTCKNRGTLWS